jgi:hypothetical protein
MDDLGERLNQLARDLVEQGKLIEAGWIGMRIACIPRDAPQIQLDEMRLAFFAGAQHLFGSLMNILDPEADVTDADLAKMDSIDKELRGWLAEFERRHAQRVGDRL